tara:strand:+ start:214 stop:792 length:579 start_codon:yes stop_codon:yes gene_type:complete
MWALVEDDNIIEIYTKPKFIKVNNVQYPFTIFTRYTKEEKKRLGIYDINLKKKPNSKFYNMSQPSYYFDKEAEVVNETFTITECDLENEQTGLKSIHKKECKQRAYTEIKKYRWLVERHIYDYRKEIPREVTLYVEKVRLACNRICEAIDNSSDIDLFKTLFEDSYDKDGNVLKVAIINDWPNDTNVRKYHR